MKCPGNQKVVVVGAGLAGMASASALAEHGLDVELLEATQQLGGRAAHMSTGGFRIDLGANLFLESYSTARKMGEKLGSPLRPTSVAIHSGIYRNGRFHGIYGDRQLGHLLKTARTFLSFQLLSPKGVWQAGKFAKVVQKHAEDLNFQYPEKILSLDIEQSAAVYFDKEIGAESLEWLYGPGLAGYAFAHPEQVGIAFAMAMLWHNGLNGAACPYLPDGGMAAFVNALSQDCAHSVKLSTPVRQIVIENGAVRGVQTNEETIEAGAVICATTASMALQLIPQLPEVVCDAFRQVTYSKCCRVFFGVDSSPIPEAWYAISFPRLTGTLISGMSNPGLLAPETVPHGRSLVDAIVIDEQAEELFALSDEEVSNRVLSEMQHFFPRMPSAPLFSHVQKWPEAICLSPGGMMTALDRLRRLDYGGIKGLFFAGDYLGIPSLDTALRSGLEAAEAVPGYLGQRLQH